MGTKANKKIVKIFGRSSAVNIRNRGGTEEIAKYFVDTHHAEIITEENLKFADLLRIVRSNNLNLILLGASKITSIKIFIYSFLSKNAAEITYIKTSNVTNKKDLIIRFLLMNVFKKINVMDLDKNYFSMFPSFRYKTLSIASIIHSNWSMNEKKYDFQSNKIRPIDIAYVGRIDYEKGFFEALKILESKKFQNYKKLIDLLLWNTEVESQVLQQIKDNNYKNLEIKLTQKNTKSPPEYHNIKCLILPYNSFNSTIRIPLVIFEALYAECYVFLPAWIKKDKSVANLLYEFQNLINVSNNVIFYDTTSENCSSFLVKKINEII